MAARKPSVGEVAPDFTLEGTHGPFALASQRGRRVVLLFYPGDQTPVCTRQFCSYRDRDQELAALDAVVVGISAQSLISHEHFAQQHRLNVPLLADPEGRVARAYGAYAAPMGTKRAVVIIDEQGIVRHRHDHLLGLRYQDVGHLAAALAKLPARAAG